MDSELTPPESVNLKAKAIESLIAGPLASSASRLLSRSRGLPSDKDFHYYNNFDEFKLPSREIAAKTESSLGEIASSISLWGSKKPPALPDELDDAYDWLVNLNDDFLEKFGISMDEFRSSREKQEQNGGTVNLGDGFQLVCGKKKKREIVLNQERDQGFSPSLGIKMVSRDKKTTAARAKVPFHLPNIPRPQIEFNILVNNKNQPFEHVWLEKNEDASSFIHPLEKLSVLDFIDRNIKEGEIVKPLSLERTPFKLVEGVLELKELAGKLREVNEFAVDLEHNNYRSFLGLTCLMQISTRMEDFIVDTFKLRVHIGPYLRELFKDPLKRKVMHGADRDILWLQRDFGIYVCNLFDTGQASRLLKLERNSLEYLLLHFCDVEANKEYQNADWRIRPLPDEMIKYAREDTHYLLHIYDLMRCKLLSSSSDGNDLLLEVYKRSSEVCLQFYEKELLTDTSYLHTYGLTEAGFDSKQLAIVSGLCEWRDKIAREEDESTGYILPNKAVLEIARQMPQTTGHLRRMVNLKHQYVSRQLNAVMKIIKHAIANSSTFESISEELRKKCDETLKMQVSQPDYSESATPSDHAMECQLTEMDAENADNNPCLGLLSADKSMFERTNLPIDQIASVGGCQEEKKMQQLSLENSCSSSNCDAFGTSEKEKGEKDDRAALYAQLRKEAIPTASVQAMRKPARGFGALFEKSSRGKAKPLNGNASEQGKNEGKVEQIKASVFLPFFSFSGGNNISERSPKDNPVLPPQFAQSPEQTSKATTAIVEDVIPLEDGIATAKNSPCGEENGAAKSVADVAESHMSLSDLSAGFQRCSQLISERRNSELKRGRPPSQEPQPLPDLKPFDYAAARSKIKFGEAGQGIKREKADVSMTGGRPPASSRDARNSFRPSRDDGEQRERGQVPNIHPTFQ